MGMKGSFYKLIMSFICTSCLHLIITRVLV